MAIYEWRCQKCDIQFETVQSIKEYNGKTSCVTCGNETSERILSADVYFIGAKVESAEYNPAFGQVVKNKRHREELAKARGLIEIGNEKPDKIHKKFESDRIEKRKKEWDAL